METKITIKLVVNEETDADGIVHRSVTAVTVNGVQPQAADESGLNYLVYSAGEDTPEDPKFEITLNTAQL